MAHRGATNFHSCLLRPTAHALRLLIVGACKTALLLSMASFAVESEGKASESEFETESVTVWLHQLEGRRESPEGPRLVYRVTQVTRGRIVIAKWSTSTPQSDGHRLANGLCAPLVR